MNTLQDCGNDTSYINCYGRWKASRLSSVQRSTGRHHGPGQLLTGRFDSRLATGLRKEGESMTSLTTAIGTLTAFSLIISTANGRSYEVHRLIHLAMQRWLKIRERRCTGIFKHWRCLLGSFQLVISKIGEFVTCFIRTCKQWHDFLLGREGSFSVHLFDNQRGRYSTAYTRAIEALEIRQRLLPENDPDKLHRRPTMLDAQKFATASSSAIFTFDHYVLPCLKRRIADILDDLICSNEYRTRSHQGCVIGPKWAWRVAGRQPRGLK